MISMHIPVMIEETTDLLAPSQGKIIVDCTLGFGGHSAAILSKGANVIGIDQDLDALRAAEVRLSEYQNIRYVQDNFANIEKIVKEPVDGVVFDLGVSSYQIDQVLRGFSIRGDGPLDMRMDQGKGITAADIVNDYPQEELERIFFEYGEERFSKRVAGAILARRRIKPIETTFELKEIIEKAIPVWKKRESVTRIFQALRIAVNSELDNLKKGLNGAVKTLKKGGRIVVISYHSLEDRIVKKFFVEQKNNGILNIITKKPVIAKEEEVLANPRAKSAKMRAAEKK
ncbi:MAG: 16S rRNA (cytosine(1402)-N(4))-methyltransferase RsmH [Candidatus Margulisiibacteriota bacterium]